MMWKLSFLEALENLEMIYSLRCWVTTGQASRKVLVSEAQDLLSVVPPGKLSPEVNG